VETVFDWVLIAAGVIGTGALLAYATRLYRWYRHATNGRPLEWLRAKLGRGRDLHELARVLGVSLEELENLGPEYRETFIPKKRGGTRQLFIPRPNLKKMQRRLLHRLLDRLRAHPAATGFERGKSIVHNAAPHLGQQVLIKMDIVDFFPSIAAARVDAYFRRIGWNAQAAALLVRLCTHQNGLPQGAPASPRLANLTHFRFDAWVAHHVNRRRGVYTRYADDITISFPKDYPRRVRGTIQFVRPVAKQLGLRIHACGKLRILRPHQQQRVTGLVVNAKVQLPRRVRRFLRAVEHHLRTGRTASLSPAQLKSWQALQKMIDEQWKALGRSSPRL
jgi:RNA-directed DNA polymerase